MWDSHSSTAERAHVGTGHCRSTRCGPRPPPTDDTFILAGYKYSATALPASALTAPPSGSPERYQPRYSLGSILTIRSRTPPEKQDWPFRAFTRACVSCIHHCTSAPRDHDFTVTAGGARSAGVTACTSTSRPLRRSTRGPTVGVAPRGEIAENRNRAARSKRPPRSRA